MSADALWTLSPRKYKDWKKAILNDSRSSLFKKAFLRDSHAVHREFLKALKRMKEPYVLVREDIGALEFEYQLLLYRLGDQRFSQMLAREQPMVRAAVRKFIPFARMPGKFSPTEKLLEGTRKIDFPVGKKEIKQVWKILGGGDGTKVALICRVRAELSGDSTQAAVRSIATLDNLAVNR